MIARSRRVAAGGDFARDALVLEQSGHPPFVSLRLKGNARPAFEKFTREHVDTHLAMVLDGRILACPQIRAAIPGEDVVFAGSDEPGGQERAKRLAIIIDSGPLPLPLTWVKSQYGRG